ncbi:MAG: hypothetical protein BV459_01835 [Thermoplasmata archaeon M11B2D]|nr:MAG: hypothetical protein BV459_01835 [Thermoplasmata archaeon M11B2D]
MSSNFDKIIAYEQGDLSETECVQLFSSLVSSGMAWSLQGHYGRTAAGLIEAGILDSEGNILVELD